MIYADYNKNIPDFLRDKDSMWFGLTSRARVIVISKKSKHTIKNYQDLAAPKFKGKVCIRSAKHPYMVGLFSSLSFHLGEDQLKNYLTDKQTASSVLRTKTLPLLRGGVLQHLPVINFLRASCL